MNSQLKRRYEKYPERNYRCAGETPIFSSQNGGQREEDTVRRNQYQHAQRNLNEINDHADQVESQLEYLENQKRRSNVRITGISEDKDKEKSWDDTEKVVKRIIKELPKILKLNDVIE
eukprot:Seg1983.3 transcript_id=Seg1983.3/GoldUCD/mRNA.D3Y31 product="hypothetical protein" protein_id=Seg1983.3/GoldUCD/D3Y31